MDVRVIWLCSLFVVVSVLSVQADEFTYVDENRETFTIQAKLFGSGQGFQALERRDGQMLILPTAAIQNRKQSEDPQPMTCEDLAIRLQKIFGEDLTRVEIQRPVVVAMILAAPLDRSAEGAARTFSHKAARFMKNVDGVFTKYAKSMDFPLRDLKFPLVLLIFESDDDFDQYADDATGGRGLSASSITGFYSGMTNWLAVRMSACDSFEVPLHEAIHQQMFNRVLQRLTSIPKWFNEGIATGFEGNGERINSNPVKVNSRYARQAIRLPAGTKWSSIVGDDSGFTADVLAGNAYTIAWCLHWVLATKHQDGYEKYVQELSRRMPLVEPQDGADEALFERCFGMNMDAVQQEFPRALRVAVRRQRVNLNPPASGTATAQKSLGEYNIDAVQLSNLGGQIQVEGMLRNISPLRPMTFYVTVETQGGLYADWLVTDLKPRQQRKLPRQIVSKPFQVKNPGNPSLYRVYVRSVPAGSEESAAWESGQRPPPVSAAQ